MQNFKPVPNIAVDGDEFTSGAPSADAQLRKSRYESGVLKLLDDLIKTWTGWAVMTDVFSVSNKHMVIRPYQATLADPFNAFARADDRKSATMEGTAVAGGQGFASAVQNSKVISKGAGGQDFYAGYRIKIEGTRFGKPYSMSYKYRLDSPTQVTLLTYSIGDFPDDNFDVKWEGDTGGIVWIIEGTPGHPAETGTGTGSDTVIRFSVETWTAPGAPTGPGSRPDEILLHEMVHGLRQMRGRAVFEEIRGNVGMQNYEEFAAIVVSNVFRSEMKLAQLRKDHLGFLTLTGPETNVETFKTDYQEYLTNMLIEQPKLCQNLKRVPAAFNPFV